MPAAGAVPVGRPRKFKEESRSLALRIPARRYEEMQAFADARRIPLAAVALEMIIFNDMLTELLSDSLQELRMSAAAQGVSYEERRAETIARLVKAGLASERKKPHSK